MNKKELIDRTNTHVCKMCGSKLEVRMIIHNQYGGQGVDLYCPNCNRIEFGISPEIYKMASLFQEKFEFNYYTDMEENEQNRRLNIGKLCEIIQWALQEKDQ